MTADLNDPRTLWDYQVPVEPRAIDCECGRALDLPTRGEAECGCGRIYNRFGQIVAIVWPPRQS